MEDDEDLESKDALPEFQVDQTDTEKIPFADFLINLVDGAAAYRGIFLAQTGTPSFDRRLRNLRLIKSQQSYGFLMSLSVRGCNAGDFEEVLKLTEAFILRRHICRERSNETEQLFAKLCSLDATNPVPMLREYFRELSPPDERFEEDFSAARFTGQLMDRARYCLEQFELHHQGKYLELHPAGSDSVHIEHIIPQKITSKNAKAEFGDWPSYLGANAATRHRKYLPRIGNLTLFAGVLNIGASNNPYARKKQAYKESAFKLTGHLPTRYADFRFAQVDKRSDEFAKLATTLWPIS